MLGRGPRASPRASAFSAIRPPLNDEHLPGGLGVVRTGKQQASTPGRARPAPLAPRGSTSGGYPSAWVKPAQATSGPSGDDCVLLRRLSADCITVLGLVRQANRCMASEEVRPETGPAEP